MQQVRGPRLGKSSEKLHLQPPAAFLSQCPVAGSCTTLALSTSLQRETTGWALRGRYRDGRPRKGPLQIPTAEFLGRKWVFILCVLGANFPTAEIKLGGRL